MDANAADRDCIGDACVDRNMDRREMDIREESGMEFRHVQVLRGPNLWTRYTVLEVVVRCEGLHNAATHEIPGFNERLLAWLPSLRERSCGAPECPPFGERLAQGLSIPHVLERVTLELQTLAGSANHFGRTTDGSEPGLYQVVVQFQEEEVGRAALDAARDLCFAAIYGRPYDAATVIQELRRLDQSVRLGPSTGAIVRAAAARGIPARRLNDGSLIQFGQGVKQRRIRTAETDRTGAVAECIAQDKELTRKLLRGIGVPVPEGRTVSCSDEAWEAAQEIGLPVVVKPQYGNHGRGVATNLTTREQVLAAYATAREEESTILVERYLLGADYRVLVINDRVIAAARREPPQIQGDGVHTIRELVDEINTDPRRGDDHATSLSKIPLDAVSLGVLAEQGFTPESIPSAGMQVVIRRNANLSTGGTAADVTDRIHPEVAARCVEAARMVGLDISGVDVVTLDITRPLEEVGGGIVEVNAGPGLRMHLEPSSGTPRAVGEAIIAMLYPEGHGGRIPVVAVTGVNGKTTTTRFITHLLERTGRQVGMSSTDGIFIDGRRIAKGDCAGPQSARDVLLNPVVEAAVLETARGGILRAGLGFDLCDVAVVTNIGDGDHLGLGGIETPEMLARVKCTVVESVLPKGKAVLNAQDPLVAAMAARCPGEVVFFSRNPEHDVILRHRQQGGRAVVVRDEAIVLVEGDREIPLIDLEHVPLTHGGRIGFQIENALATVGAAWSLGLASETIRMGLGSFDPDLDTVPGRFNLMEIAGATVVIDYGHNASSLTALIEAFAQFPHKHRTAIYSTAGDRRDRDMIRQGELLGNAFDRVIIYEDHYTRGREPGEITRLIARGLADGERVTEVLEIRGSIQAIQTALAKIQPGELLLIQADEIEEAIGCLKRYLTNGATGREITLKDMLKMQRAERAVVV
jgi:cyanophycin synthetase